MIRSTDRIEDLPIRPLTKRFVNNLLMSKPLSVPELTDFGIDSVKHYGALRTAILFADECEAEEIYKRIVELDQALGNGPMLNALVRKYAPAYAKLVHFHTSWDEIFGRSDEEQGEA